MELLDYLKEKALDNNTKNKIVYEQNDLESVYLRAFMNKPFDKINMSDLHGELTREGKYSFSKLYDLVLSNIEHYKNRSFANKTPFLLVLNDVNSVAKIIALLSLGYSPILLNCSQYIDKDKKGEMYLIEQGNFLKNHNMSDNYVTLPLNLDKIEKALHNIKSSKVVYQPMKGRIGILSSGSQGIPKLVFVDEKDIINNVLKSKFNDEERRIYNTTSISSISGLFTNVFMPLIINNGQAHLCNSFNIKLAIDYTDVYLPRNYLELLPEQKIEKNVNIKRIFVFGELNNKDLMNNIRKKISLPDNVFVHVYGCTECGGLVSEFEEKDFDELHIYYFDINNDTIVYSRDDINFCKLIRGIKTSIDSKIKNYFNYKPQKLIPCGLLSEKNMRINNSTIGECFVGDFNTEDIAITLDNKIYILGRKEVLEKNHQVGSYDAKISSLIGDRICSTFTNNENRLCVAIKYNLDYNGDNDKTTQFRRLIPLSKRINKFIRKEYPMIDDIIFLTEDKFDVSGGLKKPVRSSLEKLLNEGIQINYNLENYDEVLNNHINEVCSSILGYIPKYSLNENKNILFDKNTISINNIARLLNELSIVLIDDDGDNYRIFYDDTYFFDENKGKKYDKDKLYIYKQYARSNLLIEKLAADNNNYVKNISDNYSSYLKDFDNYTVHYKEGIDENGTIIIIPYYFYTYKKDYPDTHEVGNNLVDKYIKEKFNNITFTDHTMGAPLPNIKGNLGFLKKAIYITEEGEIYTSNDDDDNYEVNYFCSIIAKMQEHFKTNYGFLMKYKGGK